MTKLLERAVEADRRLPPVFDTYTLADLLKPQAALSALLFREREAATA